MITKFVVRRSYRNSSERFRCFDNLPEAVEAAKAFYKSSEAERKMFGFEVVVEESRFADAQKFARDFAIDRHVRWASYFDEV